MESQLPTSTTQTPMLDIKPFACHREKLIGLDKPIPVQRELKNLGENVLEKKPKVITDENAKIDIFNAVCSITTYAMLSVDVLLIDVSYHPIGNYLYVYVSQVDRNFKDKEQGATFTKLIYLNESDALPNEKDVLQQLKAIEDELIELVGLAKDRLMGAV